MKTHSEYRANFLWPFENDSIAEAAYEFANGKNEDYQKEWYRILVARVEQRYIDKNE